MLIQFRCNDCGNEFIKDELEIIYQNQSLRFCALCGGKLSIQNLKDIIKEEVRKRVSDNLNRWFREQGGDNVLDIIQRNRQYKITQLYVDELNRRGFKI